MPIARFKCKKIKQRLLVSLFFIFFIFSSGSLFASNDYYNRPSTAPNYGEAVGNAIQKFIVARQNAQRMTLLQQQAVSRQQAIENQENQIMQQQIRLAEQQAARQNAEQLQMQAQRIKEMINPILDLSEKLTEGFMLYMNGLSTTKTYRVFDVLVYSAVNNKIHQAAYVFKKGQDESRSIDVIDGDISKQIKADFKDAFEQFSSAVSADLEGLNNGIFVSKSQKAFESGKAAKILAMKSALKALEELNQLNIGVIYEITNRQSVTKIPGWIEVLKRFLQAYESTTNAFPILPEKTLSDLTKV